MIGQEPDYANYESLLNYWDQQIQRLRFKPKYATLKKERLSYGQQTSYMGVQNKPDGIYPDTHKLHYYFENAKLWRPGQPKRKGLLHP